MTVAVPAALADTTPEEETVTTEGSLDDQEKDLSVASSGETVAFIVSETPTAKYRLSLSRLTAATEIFTRTSQVAVLFPAITVIVVVPSARAVTCPDSDTEATRGVNDFQTKPS